MMNFRAFLEHNIGSVTQVSRAEINGFSHVGNLKKNENKYREDTQQSYLPLQTPITVQKKKMRWARAAE